MLKRPVVAFAAFPILSAMLNGCLDTSPPERPAIEPRVPAGAPDEDGEAWTPGVVMDAEVAPEEHWADRRSLGVDGGASDALGVDGAPAVAVDFRGVDARASGGSDGTIDAGRGVADGSVLVDRALIADATVVAQLADVAVVVDAALPADAADAAVEVQLPDAAVEVPLADAAALPADAADAAAEILLADVAPVPAPPEPDAFVPECLAQPGPDECNGTDDDCDGVVDEDFRFDATCNEGICRSAPTPSTCVDGHETACVPGEDLAFDEMLCGGVPCGPACLDTNMLRDPGVERGYEVWRPLTYTQGQWVPDVDFGVETAPERVIRGRASMRIQNHRSVSEFQVQVSHARLAIVAGRWYEVGFLARSDQRVAALRLALSIERMPDAREGGNNLGLWHALAIGESLAYHRVRFQATGTYERASLILATGATAGTIWFDELSMRECTGPDGRCAACDLEPCALAPAPVEAAAVRIGAGGLSLEVRAADFDTPRRVAAEALCLRVHAPGHGMDGREIRPDGVDAGGFARFPLPVETPAGVTPFQPCAACVHGAPLRLDLIECGAPEAPLDLGVSGDSKTGDSLWTGLDERCEPSSALAVMRLPNGTFGPAGRAGSALNCVGTFSCHDFRLNLVAAPGEAPGGNIEFWGTSGQRMPATAFVGTGTYEAPPGACTGTVDLLRGLDFDRSTMDSDVTPPVPLCRRLGGAMGATANGDCSR